MVIMAGLSSHPQQSFSTLRAALLWRVGLKAAGAQ